MFTYGLIPQCLLIVDSPNRMPSLMGFFVSKVVSMIWLLIKAAKLLPAIPGEKALSYALLTGLLGILSVK